MDLIRLLTDDNYCHLFFGIFPNEIEYTKNKNLSSEVKQFSINLFLTNEHKFEPHFTKLSDIDKLLYLRQNAIDNITNAIHILNPSRIVTICFKNFTTIKRYFR